MLTRRQWLVGSIVGLALALPVLATTAFIAGTVFELYSFVFAPSELQPQVGPLLALPPAVAAAACWLLFALPRLRRLASRIVARLS